MSDPQQPRDLIVERERLARLLAAESARVGELTAERDALREALTRAESAIEAVRDDRDKWRGAATAADSLRYSLGCERDRDNRITYTTPTLEKYCGTIAPVLDADGLPVVRTVGDLTARHIGRLVTVTEPDGTVTSGRFDFMEASDDSINLELRDNGRPRIAIAALDTPCEVLS